MPILRVMEGSRARRSSRPPRLVLRFALSVAVVLLIASTAVILFVRDFTGARAEREAGTHTRFIAGSILRDRLDRTDFMAPVTGARRGVLDQLFAGEVLVGGGLRVKLYSPSGRVTYSNDHRLIGSQSDEAAPRLALAGGTVTDASRLNKEGGDGKDSKVLEAYAPVRLDGARAVGVFELYQDYGPISQQARDAFLPITGALLAALLALYLALFPILRRVTRRLRAQMREIEHQALHDGLTGLPNRRLFADRVQQAVLEAQRDRVGFAVMLIDLNRFKEINDTLGHASGDNVLQEVARRLRGVLRVSDTVARLGGDEFGVLARSVSEDAGGTVAESCSGR